MNPFLRAFLQFRATLAFACSTGGRVKLAWVPRAAALFVILAATIPAFGQGTRSGGEKAQTGSIHGTISTTQENAASDLSGIGVKLTGGPADGNILSADTDDAGRYEFKNLKPGKYTISITQSGFKAVTKQVSVAAGQAAVQDIKLELETVNEQVEVREQTQVISTESVSNPEATITHRDLVALPTPEEKIREVLPITPGVIRTQDG